MDLTTIPIRSGLTVATVSAMAPGYAKLLKVMKLTTILLLVACLQVSASGHSQTVSLSEKQAPLEKVLLSIRQQTGFEFIYGTQMLQNAGKVTIEVNNVPLTTALELCFQDKPFTYEIIGKTIVVKEKVKNLMSTEGTLAPPRHITGRVTNENGEPLVGASISLKGTNLMALSDNNGFYQIQNVTADEYTLMITYVGYITKTLPIKVTESGTATFNFILTPSLVNLNDYTVTSTLSKRLVRAYPGTIAEIKGKDLQNRNLNNIANVLEAIPGIIMMPGNEEQNSSNLRQPAAILIRGTSAGASIKYLIDGIEIVTDGGARSILQTMDPNDIDKVEILKGPMASTLYGSGAGGGIISITTKKGKPGKTHLNFKTMFTQYANDYADYKGYSQNYSLNVSGGNDQFNYLLGTGYNLYPITKLTDTNNGIDDKTWSYTAKIGGKVKNITADLSLQYGNENSGSGSSVLSTNKYWESVGLPVYPAAPFIDYRYAQRNFMTTLHLTHTLADNWYQDLTIGYNIMNNASSSYTASSDSTYDNYEFLYSKMNARYFMFYDHPWSEKLKSSITAGFEYIGYDTRYMTIQTTTPLKNFFTASTPATEGAATFIKSPYSSTGYFAEIVTGFKNNLFLTTGIRYDVNPAYGDNVGAYPQPRVGLSYVIDKDRFKIKPRIVWGVSSTPPDPTYKTTYTKNSPYYHLISIGNQDIKPQRNQGYEFGADIFYGSNYSLNITYYDQRIKDLIQSSSTYDLTTDPLTINIYNYNIANAINRGFEVSAKAVLQPFTVDISYTQTTSKWGDETGQATSATVYPRAPSLGIPKNSIFARLSYTIPALLAWTKKGGRISLDWRYNGSAFENDYIRYSIDAKNWENLPDPKPAYPNYDDYYVWMKSYYYFNLRADYSITNYAALYIDIQNLLDKQGSLNGQSLSQLPGRRINFGFNLNF